MLGVEPNEGSKWTRGDRPVPKGRVAQIIELTDFVAEQGAAAVPLPSLVRAANGGDNGSGGDTDRKTRQKPPSRDCRQDQYVGAGSTPRTI